MLLTARYRSGTKAGVKLRRLTMEQRFPTKTARERADAATDELSTKEPMYVFVDCWIAAYFEAGGLMVLPDGSKRNRLLDETKKGEIF
jgi:hypothetical protein